MFTNKDITHKSIFVINRLERQRLKIVNFNLAVENGETEKLVTKIPFGKILCLFVIGNTSISSPLIQRLNRYGIPIVVMQRNFRVIFFYCTTAEANYLLRERQYAMDKKDLSIARGLMRNKIANQIALLKRIRQKSVLLQETIGTCNDYLGGVDKAKDLNTLMAVEGAVAKLFFKGYFREFNWRRRMPRVKIDPLNATLDIGYTILFNYMDCMCRLFGFDPYKGVYHQLWFKRKSLICDLVEPFRCIIDLQVRKSYGYGQFSAAHFELKNEVYHLKREFSKHYVSIFFKAIMQHKMEIFIYIRNYYRYFMRRKSANTFPTFKPY